MKHTPGPIKTTRKGGLHSIEDEAGHLICLVHCNRSRDPNIPDHEAIEDAHRLVACWNACLDIEDPQSLRQQRDDLLESVRKLVRYADADPDLLLGDDGTLEMMMRQARTAIAKAASS